LKLQKPLFLEGEAGVGKTEVAEVLARMLGARPIRFHRYEDLDVSNAVAVVIIISDGWDRGNLDLLEREISRLRRSATRLIWLNPLAGSPDYQPLVGGIQSVLPYVDDFYPLNNLHSLEALAAKLSSLV
jgi:uncharacterized protein with von Willebrand factor type A (vWA) domain